MSKYQAIKTTVDGITFDSKKEAQRYCQLKILEKAHKIKNLQRQVEYQLLPSQKGENRNERPVKYVADFVYEDEYGNEIVEDTKGVKTKDYIIKRKLMLYRYSISVREV